MAGDTRVHNHFLMSQLCLCLLAICGMLS